MDWFRRERKQNGESSQKKKFSDCFYQELRTLFEKHIYPIPAEVQDLSNKHNVPVGKTKHYFSVYRSNLKMGKPLLCELPTAEQSTLERLWSVDSQFPPTRVKSVASQMNRKPCEISWWLSKKHNEIYYQKSVEPSPTVTPVAKKVKLDFQDMTENQKRMIKNYCQKSSLRTGGLTLDDKMEIADCFNINVKTRNYAEISIWLKKI